MLESLKKKVTSSSTYVKCTQSLLNHLLAFFDCIAPCLTFLCTKAPNSEENEISKVILCIYFDNFPVYQYVHARYSINGITQIELQVFCQIRSLQSQAQMPPLTLKVRALTSLLNAFIIQLHVYVYVEQFQYSHFIASSMPTENEKVFFSCE